MKKGLKFTKEQLEELYLKQNLSLSKIASEFNCNGTNVLYWLKKFNIKRRLAYPKKVDIPDGLLEDLYINKKLSSIKIAKIIGDVTSRTIRKKLNRLGIKTRSLSEAGTKKFKADFSGNLIEKAYLLGLRAGDFHAKPIRKSVRVQTTSTHPAQIELAKRGFNKYGEIKLYLSKNHKRGDEWFIYVDLNSSFKFLIKKPTHLSRWIFGNNMCFYSFLAGYTDCEASIRTQKSHQNSVRFFFDIASSDETILRQMQNKLKIQGYNPIINLERKKGTKSGYGIYTNNFYSLVLNRKNEIISLIKRLIPLCKHDEKINKMKFIINNQDKNWNEIEEEWNKIREEIKSQRLTA